MSFKDEYEELTSVPYGHNAFYILSVPRPPIAEPEPKRSRYRSKAEQTLVAMMTPEERAERRRQQFLERKGITSFNTEIATQAHSDRTNSIKGRL